MYIFFDCRTNCCELTNLKWEVAVVSLFSWVRSSNTVCFTETFRTKSPKEEVRCWDCDQYGRQIGGVFPSSFLTLMEFRSVQWGLLSATGPVRSNFHHTAYNIFFNSTELGQLVKLSLFIWSCPKLNNAGHIPSPDLWIFLIGYHRVTMIHSFCIEPVPQLPVRDTLPHWDAESRQTTLLSPMLIINYKWQQ